MVLKILIIKHECRHAKAIYFYKTVCDLSKEQEWTFEGDSEEAVYGRIAWTLSNNTQICLHIGDLKQCMKAETQVLTRPMNQAHFVYITQ